MGRILTRDKIILRHRLEDAIESIESAIEEVDAIKDESCDICYDSKPLTFSKRFTDVKVENEPCSFCPACGRDLLRT